MIEGLSKVLTPKPKGEVYEGDTDDTVERVAIAGALLSHSLRCQKAN